MEPVLVQHKQPLVALVLVALVALVALVVLVGQGIHIA
jgi:hypothetical protein